MIFVAIAPLVIHLDDPTQIPVAILLTTGIIVLAFIYTWATQREFAPTAPQQLGCAGQWLVLGTLLLFFLRASRSSRCRYSSSWSLAWRSSISRATLASTTPGGCCC